MIGKGDFRRRGCAHQTDAAAAGHPGPRVSAPVRGPAAGASQIDGEPVAICSLKRYAADKAVERRPPDAAHSPSRSTGKKVADGRRRATAGLSAAYYLALEGHAG